MNIAKKLLLAIVIFLGVEKSYSGPCGKAAGVSVGVSTYVMVTSFIGRAWSQLLGQPVDTIKDIAESAGIVGGVIGVGSLPIFLGLQAAHVRDNIKHNKADCSQRYYEKAQDAWKVILSQDSSLFQKEKSKQSLMALQLALHKIADYEKNQSEIAHREILDYTPAFLTGFGLVPAIFCGCGVETLTALLAGSYCSGSMALLQAKLQECKWNRIVDQNQNLYLYGLLKSKYNGVVDIPDNLDKAINLNIALAQKRFAKECYQTKTVSLDESIIDDIINQPLEFDDAALSQADRESRITKRFDVACARNENNAERAITIFQKQKHSTFLSKLRTTRPRRGESLKFYKKVK